MGVEANSTQEVLGLLRRSEPSFHLDGVNWQLDPPVLELLLERLRSGDRTLETGCGYSTVAFALAGTRHTVVSPSEVEHDRVRAFCHQHGLALDNVTFQVGQSQDVLPRLAPEPLDLVLVDGGHAFPTPFIDWYYAANRLRVGGLFLLDDTHIRTGAILREFLMSETGRWRLEAEVLASAVFEKQDMTMIPLEDWLGQPYCAELRHVPGVTPSRWERIRARVRLRTRLRSLRRDSQRDRQRLGVERSVELPRKGKDRDDAS